MDARYLHPTIGKHDSPTNKSKTKVQATDCGIEIENLLGLRNNLCTSGTHNDWNDPYATMSSSDSEIVNNTSTTNTSKCESGDDNVANDDDYESTATATSSSSSSSQKSSGNDNIEDNNNEFNEKIPRLKHYVTETEDEDDDMIFKKKSGHKPSDDDENNHEMNATKNNSLGQRLSKSWTTFIVNRFHKPLLWFLQRLTSLSARNPWLTITAVSLVSLCLLFIGYNTNFRIDVDEHHLWTPVSSPARAYFNWLTKESHFPGDNSRQLLFMLHGKGKSVLNKKAIRLVFNATETLMNLPSYNDVCSEGSVNVTIPNGTQITTCPISGVMRFWNYSSLLYDFTVTSDKRAIEIVSNPLYPDGNKVIDSQIFGLSEREPKTGLLTSVMSYSWIIALPDTQKAIDNELDYVDIILDLDQRWQQDPKTSGYYITVAAQSSFASEFTRGIVVDLPLVPFVVVLMMAFSCFYLFRRDKIKSRCFLGPATVICIALSVLSGYGLMFVIGIPFTSMTPLVPFIILGVGLDDAFIIVDTFERTDQRKDPVDRIHDAITECGISITMTTLTSSLAFASGMLSSIPGVNWLCYYAAPTIAIVLVYQLTFYVACVVLDERRIMANRRDCCLCIKADRVKSETHYSNTNSNSNVTSASHWMQCCVKWMLRPWVRLIIATTFLAFAGVCSWSASKLEQSFDFRDVLPNDSYLLEGVDALKKYRGNSAVTASVVFRDVDFADGEIQSQMESYVNELVAMTQYISNPPASFWLYDFKNFTQSSTDVSSLSFNEQLRLFLNDTLYRGLYFTDLGFSDDGTLVESKCSIEMDKVNIGDVQSQIGVLKETYRISAAQPINDGIPIDDQKFFAYARQFNSFSFYAICVQELIGNTIMGILAVTIVSMLLIPHWSAALFVLPIVCMMYIDIMGILQWAGIKINPLSFVALVMSIGLIVDYLMHILLRYYETPGSCRVSKVTVTLYTMGASVLAGGFSTFLGTVPLAFSTTKVFWTIFISFVSLVTVALAHGLIFLPVLLASFGPQRYYMHFTHPPGNRASKEQPIPDILPKDRFSF